MKPFTDFYKEKKSYDGHGGYCKPCVREYTNDNREAARARVNRWQSKNADRVAAKRRERQYGITDEQFRDMLDRQGNCCAICAREFNKSMPPCVDHNHETGQVRALLCHSCNVGIGNLGEDPERIRAAAKYLEETADA